MIRTIEGFHQDEQGDWVAELSCLHTQHIRHRPPFSDRPWVQTPAGRQARLGSDIECPLCDRAELPDGLDLIRTMGPFDLESLPAGLRRDHRLAEPTWGRVEVLDGSAELRMHTDPPLVVQLRTGDTQTIPPGVSHALHIDGDADVAIDILGSADHRGVSANHPRDDGEGLSPTTGIGPISRAIGDRAPFGPIEHPDHDRLVAEQQASLGSPRRTYSLSARLLFRMMDALYGRERTLEKFRVLELVARVPYQAWENVAYVAVTHTARQPGFARRIFDRVRTSRWEQDNEQWHLLILEGLTSGGPRRSWLRSRVVPQLLAFAYYQLSWFMFAIRPAWSYRLNADFEDHAEHEYAHLVEENPAWETRRYEGDFVRDFGAYSSLADLFRQIGYDERLHKVESELHIRTPRFR